MIEDSVKDHSHPALMHLFYKTGEKLIARLQVPDVSGPFLIFARMDIIPGAFRQRLAPVRHDPAIMRIDIIIILYIIFMIGRRYKEGIEIDHLNAEILQIIQLIHDTLQVPSIKVTDIHRRRKLIPVLYLRSRRSDIDIFPVFHIVCRISIIETIHKDLIHHRSLCPLRGRKSRNDDKRIVVLSVI